MFKREVGFSSARFNKWASALKEVGLISFFAIMATLISPFDLATITDQASRDVFYRAWSVAYPSENRPKIGVILVSDSDLNGGSWPTPYAKHAIALDKLRQFKPRAIVIDVPFLEERNDETIVDLIEQLREYHSSGVTIFLAGASQKPDDPQTVRSDLLQLVNDGKMILVDIRVGDISGRLPTYRLKASDGRLVPASVAVFQHECNAGRAIGCAKTAERNNFEVWWGAPPFVGNCEGVDCGSISSNPVMRLASLGAQSILGNLANWIGLSEADPIEIPYHPTISWSQLTLGTVSPQLTEAFTDAVVFYGAHISLVPDIHFNPVYGKGESRLIPGVFYHAMAYDNLVTLEGNVIFPANSSSSSTLHTVVIILLLCLGGLFVRLIFADPVTLFLANVAAWIIIGAFVAWFEFSILHSGPGNWLGAILAVGFGRLISINGIIQDIKRKPK